MASCVVDMGGGERLYCTAAVLHCVHRGARDRRQDTKDKLFVRLLLDKFIVCLDQHGTITVPPAEPRTTKGARRNYPTAKKQPAEAEQRLIPEPKPEPARQSVRSSAASSVET